MIMRMRLSVTLYAHCQSVLFSMWHVLNMTAYKSVSAFGSILCNREPLPLALYEEGLLVVYKRVY
jgi:hypothetical protein